MVCVDGKNNGILIAFSEIDDISSLFRTKMRALVIPQRSDESLMIRFKSNPCVLSQLSPFRRKSNSNPIMYIFFSPYFVRSEIEWNERWESKRNAFNVSLFTA